MNRKNNRIKYTLSDGTLAVFSRYKLKGAIHKAILLSDRKVSQQSFLEELADATGNSFSAIKHWLAGHNTPSDIEKLQAIADFLNTELYDLLDTEMENKEMSETTMPIKAVDFSATRNTVRDIYIRMADYIELFRTVGVNNQNTDLLVNAFPPLYSAIMHARLDLPKDIFQNLSSFAVNYLQQLICYRMFYEVVADDDGCLPDYIDTADKFFSEYSAAYICPEMYPWCENLYVSIDEKSGDCSEFGRASKQQFRRDSEDDLWSITNEILINAAYDRLEEILKDYLVYQS